MKVEKFKVSLYLKKSGLDKNGKAPIMGRITLNRTMAQFGARGVAAQHCRTKLEDQPTRPYVIAAAQFKQKQRKVKMREMNCKWLRMSNIS